MKFYFIIVLFNIMDNNFNSRKSFNDILKDFYTLRINEGYIAVLSYEFIKGILRKEITFDNWKNNIPKNINFKSCLYLTDNDVSEIFHILDGYGNFNRLINVATRNGYNTNINVIKNHYIGLNKSIKRDLFKFYSIFKKNQNKSKNINNYIDKGNLIPYKILDDHIQYEPIEYINKEYSSYDDLNIKGGGGETSSYTILKKESNEEPNYSKLNYIEKIEEFKTDFNKKNVDQYDYNSSIPLEIKGDMIKILKSSNEKYAVLKNEYLDMRFHHETNAPKDRFECEIEYKKLRRQINELKKFIISLENNIYKDINDGDYYDDDEDYYDYDN